jgi:cytochrome c-type biogenesis protein CcmH
MSAMTDTRAATRRIAPATLSLLCAGLLALAAVAVAIVRTAAGGEAPAADPHAGLDVAQQAGSLEEMVVSLQERLRRDPDAADSWFMLGLAQREMGRHDAAEQAFRRAMELEPANADYVASLGEAVLLTSTGDPPEEARQLFARALALQQGNPQARYYLATMKDMAGDSRGAVDDLLAILADAPPGAPWIAQVRGAATLIAERNGIDISGRLPAISAADATAAIPGPTRAQLEAARAIPPGEQDAMVRGMVDGLAERLRRNPRDAEGWIRLMRSRMVLNERTAAAEALQSGLAAFEGDAATQSELRAAARQLGVPAG